ncbi:tail protein X [Pseudomonas bharatica]|uniref:tail protein X n=1 Tax=Pseudomonas bharatica TaxID=2692112 RepID=UPI003B27F578
MATTCRTSEGDLLDTLCQHYYGHLKGTVEAVLAANQGLGDEPQPYREGLLIVFPVVRMSESPELNLWG